MLERCGWVSPSVPPAMFSAPVMLPAAKPCLSSYPPAWGSLWGPCSPAVPAPLPRWLGLVGRLLPWQGQTLRKSRTCATKIARCTLVCCG